MLQIFHHMIGYLRQVIGHIFRTSKGTKKKYAHIIVYRDFHQPEFCSYCEVNYGVLCQPIKRSLTPWFCFCICCLNIMSCFEMLHTSYTLEQ
jgi:hypothetical protein